MEVYVKAFDDEKYTVEVGEDDTTEKLREKVASATGLCEDDFHMEFGGGGSGGHYAAECWRHSCIVEND